MKVITLHPGFFLGSRLVNYLLKCFDSSDGFQTGRQVGFSSIGTSALSFSFGPVHWGTPSTSQQIIEIPEWKRIKKSCFLGSTKDRKRANNHLNKQYSEKQNTKNSKPPKKQTPKKQQQKTPTKKLPNLKTPNQMPSPPPCLYKLAYIWRKQWFKATHCSFCLCLILLGKGNQNQIKFGEHLLSEKQLFPLLPTS